MGPGCAGLEAGYDHLLMARVNTAKRAREICALYQELADYLGAVALYDGLSAADRKAALASMHDRSCRIVVCVNMLGEGFDMPQLKVATVHDVKRSLSPMIQFIGRFTRTSSLASPRNRSGAPRCSWHVTRRPPSHRCATF
ncbi:helicase-related protein [Streptomyces antibioticus]|uniref:helicase-related protein n=1 Tax=Streptomyces antibioticus TaxID=1890 RepID=UPI0036DD8AF8